VAKRKMNKKILAGQQNALTSIILC
jgi:hypothetical protein